MIRASADGSQIYGAALNVNSGQIFSIDPTTYAMQTDRYGYLFWVDFAVSADGTQLAAVDAPPGVGFDVGFFDSSLRYLNAGVYPEFSPPDDYGVIGATFSPGGKVLVVPEGDSIEFWDASLGTLRARLMTPEELNFIVYPEGPASPRLALDPTGQTIYAASASGLTVITLPEPLDQMPATRWPAFVTSRREKSASHGPITHPLDVLRNRLQK
jgi:WD40 repeat protein